MPDVMAENETLLAFHRSSTGEVSRASDIASLKAAMADKDGLLWVDLYTRTEQEASILKEVFDFHPLTIEDCVSPRVDPARLDDYERYLFIIVQALTDYTPDAELEPVEVDFYLGLNYVVSCHREPIPAIEHFIQRCERDDLIMSRSPDWLLHGLLDSLVDDYLPIVDAVDDTIDRLEELVLRHPETQLLQQILLVKRNALRLRRATIPQRDIMNRLSRGEYPKLIREDTAIYYRDVYDHIVRIEYLVEALRDLADGALQTYLSVVSNRLNEVMKVLTAGATIFLPLTLISGIYGMNFTDNQFPAFEEPWGFAVVAGFMITVAVGLLAFFRYRDWI